LVTGLVTVDGNKEEPWYGENAEETGTSLLGLGVRVKHSVNRVRGENVQIAPDTY
jgi:hypothetical protein